MSRVKERLEKILKKINFIQHICEVSGGVAAALSDEEITRASILMHFTSIAE